MSTGAGEGLTRIFRDFDEEDSGSLSQLEFKNALNALGVTALPARQGGAEGGAGGDGGGGGETVREKTARLRVFG